MQTLSARLAVAADFVNAGSCVCDVGTDHGYLPVFLYKSGKCKNVCATEINEKPYQNAKKTFQKHGCDINIYLCDGLEGVRREDVDTVIITGMGGDVISGIIKRAPFLYGAAFILQPMTAAGELRSFLAKEGFCVTREQAVKDGGRIYSVMLAKYDGRARRLSAAQYRIGKLKPDTDDNIVYIKRQKDLCADICSKIKDVPGKEELYNREKRALNVISRLLNKQKNTERR